MNNVEMAKAYLTDASASLEEARQNLKAERYHRVIRRSQECVELSLKAILRLLGVEHPREHDVSLALEAALKQVQAPEWLDNLVEYLKNASRKLAEARGPSFYGDERAFTPPERLYTRDDGVEALKAAETSLEAGRKLLSRYL